MTPTPTTRTGQIPRFREASTHSAAPTFEVSTFLKRTPYPEPFAVVLCHR